MPNNDVTLSDVAVVVAARNEETHLKECIESLLVASRGEAELIFVDDGSTDRSREILVSYEPRLKILNGEGKGPGHARNLGFRASRRNWIAFTDADCVVFPDWLLRLTEGLRGASQDVASMGGLQIVSPKAGPRERLVAKFLETVGFVSDYLHPSSEILTVQHNPTCNVLYSGKALEIAAGFDEAIWPCEDLELDIRLADLGFEALFEPKAVVEHRRPPTIGAFLKMMRRYGFGHAQLVKKHGLCQPLHILPFLPLALGFWGWLLAKKPLFGIDLALASLAALAVALSYKARSIKWGLLFTFLTSTSVFVWLWGFYSGLRGERRIARRHG